MSNRKFKVKVPLDTADIRKRITDISTVEVELTEDQVIELSKQLNTPETKGRYYFPKQGEEAYYLTSAGYVRDGDEWSYRANLDTISMGVFKTKEDAEKARDRQQAIVAMDKWVQENGMVFDPDWGDSTQKKFLPYYDHDDKAFEIQCCLVAQTPTYLPHFKSKEDVEKFIECNKDNLNKLL